MSISVLILTLNEETNLPACLDSVNWSDDIVVFDSFSTDRTVEIARAAGARVFQRAFDNERAQREASLLVNFKYPWVYNPDADEVTPPELRDELLAVVADPNQDAAAFRVRFKVMFMGRWIRRSSLYPTWVVRLFRPEKLTFDRAINLTYHVDGPEGRLRHHFLHYTFNKGIAAWVEKHNLYSSMEAAEKLKALEKPLTWSDFWGGSEVARRRFLKQLAFRLPFRPLIVFLYLYFGRLGFLDGRAGLYYCLLRSYYEFLIDIKTQEYLRRCRNKAI